MNILILKLGATGDVVRTSSLLNKFTGAVTWITAPKNTVFLAGIRDGLRCLSWEQREQARDTNYDLVINLEDDLETSLFVKTVQYKQIFGAFVNSDNILQYTDDAHRWFDLSLISRHGRGKADHLKLLNRHTYQELIFDGLGFAFKGEKYFLRTPVETGLAGDVAIAADSGPVWPMKKWAYYNELKARLGREGLRRECFAHQVLAAGTSW